MSAPIEGLGVFYLGRPVDPATGDVADAPVLYDAADLTTHAFIVGMTGSGKTGLGVALLEEAALDGIPVLAIDPKGDLANLALRFPALDAAAFRPYVDTAAAARDGLSPDDLAATTARAWRDGLAAWDQPEDRIERLVAAADVRVYTPGSDAGLPVSVLGALTPPPDAPTSEAFRERVAAVVGGLLSLVGVETDPADAGPVFLSAVVGQAWAAGRTLAVADLIGALLAPPFATLGVMAVDDFYPDAARRALAMRLNGLVASPGFAAWTAGPPLDADRLFYGAGGRPQVSVMSIAHLTDDERMFFVTRLLGEVVAWMRRQPGTGSLRAVLYMDEIFGYLPPTASPPSKVLLLTLLKQARAFGVGVVLGTQNPVDLDYKALANCGTWFVGRLQTERDKARLLDGLEGAAAGSFDRAETDRLLSGLGKRRFLLHNVHDGGPTLLATRQAMSFLAGPLTRDQIGTLMAPFKTPATPDAAAPAPPTASAPAEASARSASAPAASGARPDLPGVAQLVVAAAGTAAADVYVPALLARAEVAYVRASPAVDHTERVVLLVEAGADAGDAPLWDAAEALAVRPDAAPAPDDAATFAPLPDALAAALRSPRTEADLKRWLQSARPLRLLASPALRAVSAPGEDERAFRIRLGHMAREARDAQKDDLRERYAARLDALQKRMRQADTALDREAAQASQSKIDTAVRIGTSLLGAFLGRGRGRSALSGLGTAARSASRATTAHSDVRRATEARDALSAEYAGLDAELARELESVEIAFVPETAPLDAVEVAAKQTGIVVTELALAWLPYARDAAGRLTRA